MTWESSSGSLCFCLTNTEFDSQMCFHGLITVHIICDICEQMGRHMRILPLQRVQLFVCIFMVGQNKVD